MLLGDEPVVRIEPATADEKRMRPRAAIQTRGLEIDLHPVELIESEIPEVGSTRADEVLLPGRKRQDRRLAQLA